MRRVAMAFAIAVTPALSVSGGATAATARPKAIAISVGGVHTCALMSNGTVRCWGKNTEGELGIGRLPNQWKAVPVAGLHGVTAIAAGDLTTCALLATRSVKCWGYNFQGDLGTGIDESKRVYTPVTVQGITDAVSITADCAALATGIAKCWGANQYGQLGNGTTNEPSSVPVRVRDLTHVIKVYTSGQHNCALVADHTVRCWGYNGGYQLGNHNRIDSPIPVPVQDLTDVASLALGGGHSCALMTNHTMQCWGSAAVGAIGNGTMKDSFSPALVKNLSTVAIDAGGSNTCAVLPSGAAKCWGDNTYGSSGDGTRHTRTFAPGAAVVGIKNAKKISTSGDHTCALLADGTAKCWGYGGGGRLGNGSDQQQLTPVTVLGL